jgi:hypothetical protein
VSRLMSDNVTISKNLAVVVVGRRGGDESSAFVERGERGRKDDVTRLTNVSHRC